MLPLSRATLPEEFTLRVTCPAGAQMSFGGPQEGEIFNIDTYNIQTSVDVNGSLVFIIKNLRTIEDGQNAFNKLRRVVAYAGVNKRLAIDMPEEASEPAPGIGPFISGSDVVIAHGWPSGQLPTPLAVYNTGAWIYPEHEYVVLISASIFRPSFLTSLSSVIADLREATPLQNSALPIPPEVSRVARDFAHTTRSTMWVWNLSMMVTCLEVLAARTSVNSETQNAINHLSLELRNRFSEADGVDAEHIQNCLRNARQDSISSSVRTLVVQCCAPGIAETPLETIFRDEADCRNKISALYTLRSKYSHEGRVSSVKGLKGYSWGELLDIAYKTLQHILNLRLLEGSSVINETEHTGTKKSAN